jgi:hypothetical protein
VVNNIVPIYHRYYYHESKQIDTLKTEFFEKMLFHNGEAPCTIDSTNMTLQGTTHTYLRYTARFAALSMVPW